MKRLCHCELTGMVEILPTGSGCELCVPSNTLPVTAEYLEIALGFTKQQVGTLNKTLKDRYCEEDCIP